MGYVLLKLFNKIFAICKVEGLAAAKKVGRAVVRAAQK